MPLTDEPILYRKVEAEWNKYQLTEHYKRLRNRIVEELGNSNSHCEKGSDEKEIYRNQGSCRAYRNVLRYFEEVVKDLNPDKE